MTKNNDCKPSDSSRIAGCRRSAAAGADPARDLVRDDVVLSAQTWVVKVGTSVLTGPDGTLDPARIDHLAEQISMVMDSGRKVALVSSGAVGAGMGQLGWKRRPDNLPQLQAAAAVGQAYLIRAYDEGLRRHRRHAAQLLLTHEDFDSRPRYLNMRNTLHALFECDAVPIINENDTISVDEIKFGDNDRLAAMVTNLLQASLLVILSVVDGLYRTEPGASNTAELVSLVPQIDDAVLGLAGAGTSSLGTGGMRSKLAAARQVTQAGGSVIIASGTKPEPLTRILAGEPAGTLFLAHGATHRAAKRWIGLTARPRGHYRRGRRCAQGARIGHQQLARHRHHRGDRRIREGGRRRYSRFLGSRVRPRAHQLRDRRRRADPGPAHPRSPPAPWAQRSMMRSSTATTSS